MQGGFGGGYGGGPPGGGGGWGPPQGGPPPGGAPPGGGYGPPQGGAPPGGGYGPPQGGAPPGGGYGPPQGGAPPGGGYGPPQGGAPPGGGAFGPPGGAPPGGYGAPPPGGGYGAPPGGGGWAPPPAGGNPGGGDGFNFGAPMGPQQTGMNRFFKSAAIGGAIGGILSSIPLLDCLNWCFCLLNLGGAVIAVQMYLKENSQERLDNGEAATCGGIAGVVAGLIRGILGLVIGLVLGPTLLSFYAKQLPPDMVGQMSRQYAGNIGMMIIMIPLYVILYGAFGALGGVISMSVFFKDRAKR